MLRSKALNTELLLRSKGIINKMLIKECGRDSKTEALSQILFATSMDSEVGGSLVRTMRIVTED